MKNALKSLQNFRYADTYMNIHIYAQICIYVHVVYMLIYVYNIFMYTLYTCLYMYTIYLFGIC